MPAGYDRARAAMLADLNDPERAFAFAEAAVAAGDLRGAIDALERVLTLDPELTNIRMELGLLYLRAGSPDQAEGYLRQVLASPATPPGIRDRAQALVAEAEAARARHAFGGALSFGLRHETNASASPDSVLVGGLPFAVSDADAAAGDIAAIASLRLRHSYDLGGQYGPFIETDLTAYGAVYDEVTSSDVAFLRLTSGPRFRFGIDAAHSARPYLGLSTLALGREHYRDAAILGTEASFALDDRTVLGAEIETRWQTLHESDVNPTALNFEGRQHTARLRLERALGARITVDAELSAAVADLSAAYESNTTGGVDLGVNWTVGNPLRSDFDPALLRVSAGYARAAYDAPNPQIDPTRTQRDDRWRVGLGALVPVSDRLLLDVGLDYAKNDSTLPNDTYENFQVSIGLRYNFGTRR